MKRTIKLLIILLSLVLITGCGKEKGYNLIELTGSELIGALYNKEQFIYATINPNDETGQNFIRDLKRVAKEHHTDIYYIDNTKVNFYADETIYIINNIDTRKNVYFYSGDLNVAYAYTNYNDIEQNLKNYKSNKITTIISDSDKKKELELAKKAYNEGKLAESFKHLNESWTLKEAKEFYNDSKYFKILNKWEYKSVGQKNIVIKKFAMFNVADYAFTYTYKGPKADYIEPLAKDYTEYTSLVKDDKIYVEKNGEYVERFKIISLKDNELILEEENIQTVYNLEKKENNNERA